jgi:phosphoribosylanthranilate isomerase
MMGFIFYKKSPRYFNNALTSEEARQLPKHLKKVGVFVNEPIDNVLNTIEKYDLNAIQLHGEESTNYCKELVNRIEVIKTISVKDRSSIELSQYYQDVCTYLLFDTATPNYGGSGKSFNKELLKDIDISKPYFISGGISPEHFNQLKDLSLPNFIGVDLNSKFEVSPGIKNIEKIKQFLKINGHANTSK